MWVKYKSHQLSAGVDDGTQLFKIQIAQNEHNFAVWNVLEFCPSWSWSQRKIEHMINNGINLFVGSIQME